MSKATNSVLFLFLVSLLAASAQRCGRQVGGRQCDGGLCCSYYGLCGTTYVHCGPGCQSNCRHIAGKWTPSGGLIPGSGVITNIIKGSVKCNRRVADRIGFYRRRCDKLGVSYGDNFDSPLEFK